MEMKEAAVFVMPGLLKTTLRLAGWLWGCAEGSSLLASPWSTLKYLQGGLEDQVVLPTEHPVSQLLLHWQSPEVLLLAC